MERELNLNFTEMGMYYLAGIMLAVMIVLAFLSPAPNGRDAWFHILVGRAWFRGEIGMISPVVMDINRLPYPPLYHLILMPFCSSVSLAVSAQIVLQTVFYPLGLLGIMLLVRKEEGERLALATGFLLTGTYFAFNMMQARPQSMELLFSPVALWSVLEDKTKTFILSVAAMFYLHSPLSLSLALGLSLYALREDWKDPKILITVALVAPLILYQGSFMLNQGFMSRWVSQGDLGILKETTQFMENPAFWILNGLGISIIGLIHIPWQIYRWKLQTTLTKLMLLSYCGFWIALPVWYMRVFQFAMIPLAFSTGQFILKRKGYVKYALLALVVLQALWFTIHPVWWMSPPDYFDQYW